MKKRFVVPSLLAAGFSADGAQAMVPVEKAVEAAGTKSLFDVFRLQHEHHLAAHRSHRSHSSHRSHRSGSSGSPVPKYNPPSRNRDSTPPSSVLPQSPSTAPQKTLPGNSAKFSEIVRRVQAALYATGYYTGALDGLIGPQTKAALAKYQKDQGLAVTGTITKETLDALRIAAK